VGTAHETLTDHRHSQYLTVGYDVTHLPLSFTVNDSPQAEPDVQVGTTAADARHFQQHVTAPGLSP
jgi:hypothetical protein